MSQVSFEERLPIIQIEIAKRRNKWLLQIPDFQDISQILLIRVYNKYHLYDPAKVEFTHWLNRLISNEIKNQLRNNSMKWQRPCALGCAFAVGADECSLPSNKSGKQCEECPLYRRWKQKKESQYFVNQTLTLENHSQEVNNLPNDFLDIAASKDIIDKELKKKLNAFEWSVYEMLYIKHMTMEEVGTLLKYKKCKNSKIPGSQNLKKLRVKYVELTKQIILEQGLA